MKLPIVDLLLMGRALSWLLAIATAALVAAAVFVDVRWSVALAPTLMLYGGDVYFRRVQLRHAILRNFGLFGWLRYLAESIGPELRQYWIASDTEERPFSRQQRAEVYRYAKDEVVQNAAFGTQEDDVAVRIRHSLYPLARAELTRFRLILGASRGCPQPYTLTRPFFVGALSHGALGGAAVRALARGAGRAGIPINTGEGGYPRYHLMENADLIFQIGTAKFGVRTPDGALDEDRLREIASLDAVKMIELKLSQGAKPGKGGVLPAAKVTDEIASLRGVRAGETVLSPPRHAECSTPARTVRFIGRLQRLTGRPVGIKLCIGSEDELRALVDAMCALDTFPDYIALDGAEGGTGAAPQSFLDHVGLPLFPALELTAALLEHRHVRRRTALVAGGKLIGPAAQLKAFAYGADAVYTARGFMLALGCIQARVCNIGSCPVGITTHDPELQRGLDIEHKATRVANYARGLDDALQDLLAATGCRSTRELRRSNLFESCRPWSHADSEQVSSESNLRAVYSRAGATQLSI